MMRSTLLVVLVLSALMLTQDVAAWRTRRLVRAAVKAAAVKILLGKRSADGEDDKSDCTVSTTYNGNSGEAGFRDAVLSTVEEFESHC